MAQMTSAAIDDLPDSDFAYIEPGGKVVGGKTEPRSLRHFPIHDAAHVRNALSQLSKSPFGEKARAKVEAAAKRMGIGQDGKATELKAEDMSVSRLDRWLKGEIPRRILVVPFGGPIPMKGAPLGVDLDGEWFDADTDIYGAYPALRASRERLVDWHHTTFADRVDPVGGRMKGAILGKIVLDEDASDDGVWADFWANAGEQRRKLVADLERRSIPLYGSTQPLKGAVVRTEGHIDVWPVIYHTISTSPQNTYAVVPALKAMLTESPLDEIGLAAVKAALLGLSDSLPDLRPTFQASAASDATSADQVATDVAMEPSIHANQIVTAGVSAAVRRLMAVMAQPENRQ